MLDDWNEFWGTEETDYEVLRYTDHLLNVKCGIMMQSFFLKGQKALYCTDYFVTFVKISLYIGLSW